MDKSDNVQYEDYKHTDFYKENDPNKGLDHYYGQTLYALLLIFIGLNVAVILISFFL